MPLSKSQREEISSVLKKAILKKMEEYSPETKNMPFHFRLLGKDRMALFSFIQSLNTTFGTSVFEPVAVAIARPHFAKAINQYKEFNNTISRDAQQVIQAILDDLTTARTRSDREKETQKILEVAHKKPLVKIKRPTIDVFLLARDGTEFYFDLKTVKPNINDFKGYKRQLLEWLAIRGAVNPTAKIKTLLAIPYNPYEPEPYQRWTLQGLFDLPNEIKVADEFWNFLGGEKCYEDLLDVFEKVGLELRPEVDARFKKFIT